MATPAYQGPGQPPADGGESWLGRLGSFLGAKTPAYTGAGQPVPSVGGFGSGTPVYASASAVTPPKDAQPDPKDTIAAPTVMRCPIDPSGCPVDPAALAAGQIAIVIPRLGCTETIPDSIAQE